MDFAAKDLIVGGENYTLVDERGGSRTGHARRRDSPPSLFAGSGVFCEACFGVELQDEVLPVGKEEGPGR